MTIITSAERARQSAEREQQRFDHLVLGRPRPLPEIGAKPKGMSKAEWRVKKDAMRKRGAELAPGIEERVQLRELYETKNGGTPETRAHLDHRQRRSGAIARLYTSGAIDADQLAAADAIATTYRAVTADAPLRTASWETRTDTGGGGPGDVPLRLLGSVLGEWELCVWLRSVRQPEAMLDIIVRDVGLTIAARRYALSVPRTRDLVREALSTWWGKNGRARIVAS